jgi:hypothetical protein
MNDELQVRAKHFASLKSKYKATQYEDSSPSSLLYLILRKADLEIELTDLELDWLRERQLFDTIDLIGLARRRTEEPKRLETEFYHLKSKYQVGKAGDSSLASRLYPILWELDSEGNITDAEVEWLQQQGFDRTASLAQEMGRFAALKAKYKATYSVSHISALRFDRDARLRGGRRDKSGLYKRLIKLRTAIAHLFENRYITCRLRAAIGARQMNPGGH